MAKIIGGMTTSHVPAIGGAIAKGLQGDPYWKPFFDGFLPVREWLAEVKPDVAVVFYNDHGLNFFLDKMPTFAVGAAPEYRNADEGWGIPALPRSPGATRALVAHHRAPGGRGVRRHHLPGDAGGPRVDPAARAVLAAGRAGDDGAGVHQHRAVPLPSRGRCFALGQASGGRSRPGTATSAWW